MYQKVCPNSFGVTLQLNPISFGRVQVFTDHQSLPERKFEWWDMWLVIPLIWSYFFMSQIGGTGHPKSQYARQLTQYFSIPRVLSEGEVFSVLPHALTMASILSAERVRQEGLSNVLKIEQKNQSKKQDQPGISECRCHGVSLERLKQMGESGRLWRCISLMELGLPSIGTWEPAQMKDPGGHLLSWCCASSMDSTEIKQRQTQDNEDLEMYYSSYNNDPIDGDNDVLDLWNIWDHNIGIQHGSVIPRVDPVEGLARSALPFFVVESLLTDFQGQSISAVVDTKTTSLVLSPTHDFTTRHIPLQAEYIYRLIPRSIPSNDTEWFHR